MYWVSVKPVKHKKHTRIANHPEFCHTAGPAQTFLATKRRPQTKARGAYRYSFYAFTVLCSNVKIWKVEVGLKFCPEHKSGPYSTGNKMVSNMFGRSLKQIWKIWSVQILPNGHKNVFVKYFMQVFWAIHFTSIVNAVNIDFFVQYKYHS